MNIRHHLFVERFDLEMIALGWLRGLSLLVVSTSADRLQIVATFKHEHMIFAFALFSFIFLPKRMSCPLTALLLCSVNLCSPPPKFQLTTPSPHGRFHPSSRQRSRLDVAVGASVKPFGEVLDAYRCSV